MNASSPAPNRDPLATLRIDRSSPSKASGGRRITRWLLVVVILFSLALGGYTFGVRQGWIEQGQDSAQSWLDVPDMMKARPEVRVVRPIIERGRSADASVVATGYLESRRQAKIGARAPGRIQEVKVEEGSRVTKDQILAVLEHADLDASLSAMQASLARSRAALGEQEILIEQSRREFDRLKKLQASSSASETEFDQARFAHESAVARLASMKADVALAEARLREAEQLRENMFIRAPFDGTVISKDAEVGESILPGGMGEASGRGSAVTIADLDNLEVDCDVKEDYIGRIKAGQKAEVAVDAVPSRRFQGTVRKVIPMGDRARATIKVKVTITGADESLFPDMSSTVYFLSDELNEQPVSDEPRMFCPESAVVVEGEKSQVWIVDSQLHAQPLPVTTGKAKDGKIEILSGLAGNEKVIAKPNQLQINQPVKITE